MIRQPSLEAVANMLKKAFNDVDINYGRQNVLNLAAKTQGYKNYAHYKVAADRKAALQQVVTPAVPALPVTEPSAREVALATALEWVTANLESVLASKPVRDADECLVHANLLLNRKPPR